MYLKSPTMLGFLIAKATLTDGRTGLPWRNSDLDAGGAISSPWPSLCPHQTRPQPKRWRWPA